MAKVSTGSRATGSARGGCRPPGVAEPQDRRRDHQHRQREDQGDRRRRGRSPGRGCGWSAGGTGGREPPPWLRHPLAARPPRTSAPRQFVGLAEQRHPVAGGDARGRGPGRRSARRLAARRRPGRGRRTARAGVPGRRRRPRRRRSARRPARRRGWSGSMQASITAGAKSPATSSALPLAGRLFDGAADGRVVEVGDDGDVVAQVAGQERRLDVAQVAGLGADDGAGVRRSRPRQLVVEAAAGADVGAPQPSTSSARSLAGSSSTTTTCDPGRRAAARPCAARPPRGRRRSRGLSSRRRNRRGGSARCVQEAAHLSVSATSPTNHVTTLWTRWLSCGL